MSGEEAQGSVMQTDQRRKERRKEVLRARFQEQKAARLFCAIQGERD